MTARSVTGAKAAAGGPAQAKALLTAAYTRLFSGQGSQADADMVMSDLLNVTGFFRPPNYAEWMAKTKTPQGFELHCALQAARAEPMRHIMNFLSLPDEQVIEMERAARVEAGR